MKKAAILIILTLSFLTGSSAQEKKYIIVPIKIYKFNKVDIYGLSSLTSQLFAKAGYQVLSANKMSWPKDLQANLCNAIYTETEDVSPLIGLTKVKLTLKDCYHKVLAEAIGKDNDVDDIKALQVALEEAFETLKKGKKIENAFTSLSQNSKNVAITQTTTPEKQVTSSTQPTENKAAKVSKATSKIEILKSYWQQFEAKGIEGIYTKKNEQFYVKYDNNAFTLYNSSNVILAKIVRTSASTIFKIQWNNGTEDVGYLKDSKTLVLENTEKGVNTVSTFRKEFPRE